MQKAVGWTKGFPGAQPVSMTRANMGFLREKPYKVSWKADGTRYMMLLDGEDEVYFIDRDNCVYQVRYLCTCVQTLAVPSSPSHLSRCPASPSCTGRTRTSTSPTR